MESSSRIQSEEPLHPGDVFMMFASDGKVQVTSANGRFFRSFEHFSIHCATALLNQMRPPYGNSFFVHWRFENPASVWAGNENISIYPRRLLQAVRDQGLRPRATRRLYPLLYGIQKGCDTRQMADLYDNPDYLEQVRLYEGFNVEERPLSYRGIETDAGVRKLEIVEGIRHEDNQISQNSIRRHLPDVAGRLTRRPAKKRGSFDKVLQNREFGVSLQNLDANSVEAT